MRLLLDTNAYTGFMRSSTEVAAAVRRAERVYVSSIVVGELLYGFRSGTRRYLDHGSCPGNRR